MRESLADGLMLLPSTADKTNQTNLLWVPCGRGRGWASEPPVVQHQASALAKAGESVAPGVWTAQAEIGRHQPAVDRTGIAAAAARAQVGAARAQLRAVLGQQLGDRPALLASPLPAHLRLHQRDRSAAAPADPRSSAKARPCTGGGPSPCPGRVAGSP